MSHEPATCPCNKCVARRKAPPAQDQAAESAGEHLVVQVLAGQGHLIIAVSHSYRSMSHISTIYKGPDTQLARAMLERWQAYATMNKTFSEAIIAESHLARDRHALLVAGCNDGTMNHAFEPIKRCRNCGWLEKGEDPGEPADTFMLPDTGGQS